MANRMTFKKVVGVFITIADPKIAMNATKRSEITQLQKDFFEHMNFTCNKSRWTKWDYSQRFCNRAVRVGLAHFQSSDYVMKDNNWMYVKPGRRHQRLANTTA